MRIFYDQQIFASQAHGGISRYFFELISHLADGGLDRIFWNAGPYRSTLPIRSLGARCDQFWGRQRPRLGPLWSVVRPLANLYGARLLARSLPEIYHATSYDHLPSPGARRVTTVHDMTHERFPQYFPVDGLPARKRIAAEEADAVICVSHATRRDLLDLYPHLAEKVHVVHHGSSLVGEAAPEDPNRTHRPYLLFVGMRAGYKNFETLVEACRRIPNFAKQYSVVCFGSAPFTPGELDTLKRAGQISCFSHVNGNDRTLCSLYSGASAFVYPSLNEGFGIPIIEAMSCHCPVISSNSSSLPEVGGDAALYFDPASPDELAERIVAVLEHPAVRAELIEKGRNQARNFSWERCAQETRAIYKSLLDQA